MKPIPYIFVLQFFKNMWRLFTSWEIPGTNVTPGSLAIFILCVSIILNTIKRISNTPDASFGGSSRGSGGSNLPANR